MIPQAHRLMDAIKEIFGESLVKTYVRVTPIYGKDNIVVFGWNIGFVVLDGPQADAPIVAWKGEHAKEKITIKDEKGV